MEFSKAKIILYEGSNEKFNMDVHFNPESYSITTHGKAVNKQDAGGGVKAQPVDQCRQTLTMKLVFDTYEKQLSVREYTDKLVDIVNSYKKLNETKSIPNCKFVWGTLIFRGYMTSIKQDFTMFLPDGKPVRANVDITIESDMVMSSEKEQQEKEARKNEEVNLADYNLFDEDNPRLQ